MIYTLDTIPAKLYYHILETGNVHLLSDEELPVATLDKLWEDMQAKDLENNPDNSTNKSLDIHKTCEHYLAKYEAIRHAIHCLKYAEDKELIDLIRYYGYTYNSKEDLERIAQQSESIFLKIDRQKARLPKKKESKHVPFDEMVISCGVISGTGFIDTNTITKTQLDALVKVTMNKIKASQKNGRTR